MSLPGLVAWWDANAISGVADGAAIASVADLSGNGRTLTQGTGLKQPLLILAAQNGLAVIRFDGSNDALATAAPVTTTLAFSVFIAYQIRTVATNRYAFVNGASNVSTGQVFGVSSASNRNVLYAGVADHEDGAATTNFEVACLAGTGAKPTLAINGVTQVLAGTATAPNQPTSATTLGASGAAGGSALAVDIGEVFVSNINVTGTALSHAWQYLTRWGVAITIP